MPSLTAERFVIALPFGKDNIRAVECVLCFVGAAP